MKCERSGTTGFSMIEVMVAVLVLSTSMLGLALLQVSSLRASNGAYLRSQAIVLAYDIQDRMRANASVVTLGCYDLDLTGPLPLATCAGALLTEATHVTDLTEWRSELGSTLPQGIGSVSVDPASKVASVTIQWQDNSVSDSEDQTLAATTNSAFTITTEL